MEQTSELLGVEAVQKILGVGANGAREIMHKAGGIKWGRRSLRVKRADLERWIEAQREVRQP